MYWYVLFIKTGRESYIERFLKKLLDPDIFMPFIPMHETLFKISGQVKVELKPLFPGYIFVESIVPSLEFIKKIYEILYISHDIFRLLKYGDTDEIAMRDSERDMLLSLCNDDYCIESSSGIKVGNKVYIKEGPLKGQESIVKKIDRHKRQATIELEFMGDVRQVIVGLEVL